MDCNEIIELFDAYALGASDGDDVRIVEAHVAECVHCWEELSKAQQTAALIALSVHIESAPAGLERKIMSEAARDRAPGFAPEPRVSVWQRLSFPWRATAGAFGIASVAALAVSGLLAFQMQDLRSENDTLESQLQATAFDLREAVQFTDAQIANQQSAQQTILTVLTDENRSEVAAQTYADGKSAQAYYTWSIAKGRGFIVCEDLPSLEPGQVFQVWFSIDGKMQPVRSFLSTDGTCQVTMETGWLKQDPTGIGVTIENSPGASDHPSEDGFLLYAHFPAPTPVPEPTVAAPTATAAATP